MVVHASALELSGTRLRIAIWVSTFVAAAVFARSGAALLGGAMIGQFEQWGYAPSFSITIGVLELIGAIGLLIPRSSACAALGLIVIMFGAVGIHALEGDYVAALAPAAIIGLLGFVLFGRGMCQFATAG
jgi:uncharacterized membrane protein YphA (DoxX/SURF4 family)